jgi:hypothetical protein
VMSPHQREFSRPASATNGKARTVTQRERTLASSRMDQNRPESRLSSRHRVTCNCSVPQGAETLPP